jgi:hypothetical protein
MSAWRRLLSSAPLLVLLAVAGLVSSGAPAAAHVGSSTGYAQARTEGTDLALTLRLDYIYVATAVGLGPEARNARDQAAQAEALETGAPALGAYFTDHVRVYVDGVGCDPELTGSGVDEHQGTRFGRIDLVFDCPDSFDGSYHLEYDAFSSPDAAVDHDELVLGYQVSDETGRAVLDRSRPTWTVGETSGAATAGSFVMMGGQHILFGLDHVLFVVALLLGSRRVRDLVTVASLFTLAHSVTLVMTALNWIEFPAWLVEPMIALSIAFVAVDNLLGRGGRLRLAAVFGFGLLHGMGFAGSLRFDDELSWGLIGSLLSFNVGVELGQAAVLSAVFPLVVLARRTRWSSHVLVAATSAVAGVGAFWFVERVGQVL